LRWEDGLPAYTFAAWRRWFVGYIQLLAGRGSIFVLFVFLTLVLRDPWLQLGIPAAYLGIAVGAPGDDTRKRPARVFLTAFALFGFFKTISVIVSKVHIMAYGFRFQTFYYFDSYNH